MCIKVKSRNYTVIFYNVKWFCQLTAKDFIRRCDYACCFGPSPSAYHPNACFYVVWFFVAFFMIVGNDSRHRLNAFRTKTFRFFYALATKYSYHILDQGVKSSLGASLSATKCINTEHWSESYFANKQGELNLRKFEGTVLLAGPT